MAPSANKNASSRPVAFDLAQLLKDSGLSQEDFCAEVGICRRTFIRARDRGVCGLGTRQLIEGYVQKKCPPSISELSTGEVGWQTVISAAKMLGLTPAACLRAITGQIQE